MKQIFLIIIYIEVIILCILSGLSLYNPHTLASTLVQVGVLVLIITVAIVFIIGEYEDYNRWK